MQTILDVKLIVDYSAPVDKGFERFAERDLNFTSANFKTMLAGKFKVRMKVYDFERQVRTADVKAAFAVQGILLPEAADIATLALQKNSGVKEALSLHGIVALCLPWTDPHFSRPNYPLVWEIFGERKFFLRADRGDTWDKNFAFLGIVKRES